MAVVRRSVTEQARYTAGSLVLLATTTLMVVAPWIGAVALAGMGFGAAMALVWVTLLTVILRLRPGQVGTTQAVISGLSTVRIAIPPLVGLVADRLGLATGMWLFVLAPAAILLLAQTARQTVRA